MKKKTLILNSTQASIGAPLDGKAYHQFFNLPCGGGWKDCDIISKDTGISKSDFQKLLSCLKKQDLDYFIFVYSGHGGMEIRNFQTLICLDSGEYVCEDDILGVAKRQLSIFDCCRGIEPEVPEAEVCMSLLKESAFVDVGAVTRAYESAVRKAPKAQYVLYSCHPDQYSFGSSEEGGVFTKTFIGVTLTLVENAENKLRELKSQFIDVELAFNLTYELVSRLEFKGNKKQVPEAYLPKSYVGLPWAMIPSRVSRPTVRELVNL